ncbi:MAG: Crp/Fnr family transcriptional regulator [Steroidobacteraceae bacterium]|jgi:CRP/FNR family transcriptional regulator, cyclic AMP receptor protein
MIADERAALALAAVSSTLAPIFRGRLCEILLTTRGPRIFERHAIIYDLGETDRSLFFIRQGLVKIGTITEEGREIIYDVRTNGDVVGELCALDRPRRDRAVVIDTTAAIAIKFEEVVAALAGNSGLLATFITALGGVLADAYDQLNHVARGDVTHGVVAVLKTLARKLGRPRGALVEINAYLTQEELAQMVAARRERVSTALNTLRRDGAINYSGDGHLLLDLAALDRHLAPGR